MSAPLTSVGRLGARTVAGISASGDFVVLGLETARALLRPRFPWRDALVQFDALAVRSTPIVVITAVFTGMVLALQAAFALTRFGAKPYVGSIVGLSIVRELGPVLAALMVGGRVGAGIASELGSMAVTEQVDAIRAMGADPAQKLALPRVLATTIGLPLLTFFAIVLGVAGGMFVADLQFAIAPSFYRQTVVSSVEMGDFFSGVLKTVFFGWWIGMVGAFVGLRTTGGTAGVGQATTRAVVVSSIGVLISDFFLTKLFMLLPAEQALNRVLEALR
ncbi:MAG TPA: ABC transporter permease [Myxococcota bacterium]|nr:ABC transporter permease [Myxococcota bacterium]